MLFTALEVIFALTLYTFSVCEAILTERGFEPPLFQYDDYESCISKHDPAVYCVLTVVTPMDEQDKNHKSNRIVLDYLSNLLYRGVCIQECEQELSGLDEHDKYQLRNQSLEVDFLINYSIKYFPEQEKFKEQYEQLVTQCANNRLKQTFNQTGSVQVQFCKANGQGIFNRSDWVANTFVFVTISLFGLMIFATVQYKYFDLDNPKDVTFTQCFACERTWNSLTRQSNDQIYQDFRYIEGIRVLSCAWIVFIHCDYEKFMMPSKHPEVIQQMVNNWASKLSTTVVASSVHIFFTMSGLLLAVHFYRGVRQKSTFEWNYLTNKVINRLVRLLPVYGFWIIFSASWNGRIPDNPMAIGKMEMQSYFCRYNWWLNILFVNNLPFVEELCMIHSWYLSADMQLFILCLGLLACTWRYPMAASKFLIIAALVAMLTPAVVVYVLKLDPICAVTLNELLHISLNSKWIRWIYMPSPTNFGCSLAGLIAGYVYDQIDREEIDLRDTKIYKIIKKLSLPVMLLSSATALLWYEVELQRPSIWISLYTTINRNCVSLLFAIYIVEGIRRPKSVLREFFSSRLFAVLGKLCYIVYIVHYSVLKLLFNHSDDANQSFWFNFILTLFGSFVVAFIIFSLVEQPLGVYFKQKLIATKKTTKIL